MTLNRKHRSVAMVPIVDSVGSGRQLRTDLLIDWTVRNYTLRSLCR